jgi:endonuclease YncB( thermonuclease family)
MGKDRIQNPISEKGMGFCLLQEVQIRPILAYVYLMDGTFLNAEIIKQGYGFAYTKYPFK